MPGMRGSKRRDGKISTIIGRSHSFRSGGHSGISWSRLAGTAPTGVCSASTQEWDTGIADAKTIIRRAATTRPRGGAKGTPPRFAEVFVTQPYGYSLEEMVEFAREQGLWFWVSERPAWHYPLGVLFIEWANPESQFARLRGAAEADAWMRTIHAWKGEVLLSGPGTSSR